ncbi:MAG: GNAT family N-acetyltransferase [Gammaproteobacteria bacterium]
MNNEKLKVEKVSWQDEKSNLRQIRTTVFVEEQKVPEELEWDEYDETCIHVLASINNEFVATGRLLETGQIGRMAVLKSYREQGVGSKILEKLLVIAESIGFKTVFLNSQVDAISFYNRFGFKEEGGVFDDAGIPHKRMTKQFK